MVLDVLAHSQLASLLWACGEMEQMAERVEGGAKLPRTHRDRWRNQGQGVSPQVVPPGMCFPQLGLTS